MESAVRSCGFLQRTVASGFRVDEIVHERRYYQTVDQPEDDTERREDDDDDKRQGLTDIANRCEHGPDRTGS